MEKKNNINVGKHRKHKLRVYKDKKGTYVIYKGKKFYLKEKTTKEQLNIDVPKIRKTRGGR